MQKTYKLILTTCIIILCIVTIGELKSNTKKYKIEECTIDTITVYNPTKNQCDSEPLVTASRDTINLKNFPDNFIALSRDLIDSGEFQYGDSILVFLPDSLPKKFLIKDTKNKRYKNHGDILHKNKKYGMWFNVKIVKL